MHFVYVNMGFFNVAWHHDKYDVSYFDFKQLF